MTSEQILEEEDRQDRVLEQARRERRERRRERRRLQEEGADLPAYSKLAAAEEQVLEMSEDVDQEAQRQRRRDSTGSGESDDDDERGLRDSTHEVAYRPTVPLPVHVSRG